MTQQHYHHIFTPTNTAHILHENDRKTTFRKLIFHSGSVSPAAATLKESSAYLCVGHDRKTKTQWHVRTNTRLYLYRKLAVLQCSAVWGTRAALW